MEKIILSFLLIINFSLAYSVESNEKILIPIKEFSFEVKDTIPELKNEIIKQENKIEINKKEGQNGLALSIIGVSTIFISIYSSVPFLIFLLIPLEIIAMVSSANSLEKILNNPQKNENRKPAIAGLTISLFILTLIFSSIFYAFVIFDLEDLL